MIEFNSSRRYRRRAGVRYLIAALSVAAALVLTWGLKQLFPTAPNALYFCAIILSAWFGGFGPGILASVLTSAAVHFTPPASTTDLRRDIVFLVAGIFTSWLIERQNRAQAALQRARDEFELQLNERTGELTAANEGLRTEISERKQMENALRESESQLRLVIDTIPTMAWIVLPDGALDFINQRWLEYSGLSLQEALKDPKRTIHPDDLPRVMEKWSVNLVSRQPYEDEMRLRRAGGEYRWFLVRTVPLLDEQGNILQWYGTSTDIEDLKRAERALLRAQSELARVARLTVMGELTASIAHEVNQPLAAVVTNANASFRRLACNCNRCC